MKKGGHELEGYQGKLYGRAQRKEREVGSYVITISEKN